MLLQVFILLLSYFACNVMPGEDDGDRTKNILCNHFEIRRYDCYIVLSCTPNLPIIFATNLIAANKQTNLLVVNRRYKAGK